MKFLSILIFSVILVSCGASVAVDYDKQVDFSKYNSYNYFPNIDSGLNELDDKRIIKITDSLLQQRGFVKSETPQIYINFYARESVSSSRNTIGIGIGSGGGNVGVLFRVGLAVLPGEQRPENAEADETNTVDDDVGHARVRQIVDDGFAEIVQGVSHCRFLSVGLGLARFVIAVNDTVPGRHPVVVAVEDLSCVGDCRAMRLHPIVGVILVRIVTVRVVTKIRASDVQQVYDVRVAGVVDRFSHCSRFLPGSRALR